MIRTEKYKQEDSIEWNKLVEKSKNTSFLFYREFMEYHSDRYMDYSLTFWIGQSMIAALPANRYSDTVYSHQGLSYGGFIVSKEVKFQQVLEIFHSALKFMSQAGVTTFIFKSIPRIYNTIPCDEIDWALTIVEAQLFRRDSTLAIHNGDPLPFQQRRIRSIKKASRLEPVILSNEGEGGFERFWSDVLTPNMMHRFGIKPVHTVEEIVSLHNKFPQHIRQYNIYYQNRIMAGCTMFLTQSVAHAQYISGTEEGRQNGCLDFLFNHLIKCEFNDFSYFDFGNCNEDSGKSINIGLLDWKEGFGARAISHDFYEVRTQNYEHLNRLVGTDGPNSLI